MSTTTGLSTCHSPSPDKERYFVCLSAVAPFPITVWVLSLSLLSWHAPSGSNSTCLFWVVCHPNSTLPPKELEQEPQKLVFPLSPPPNHALLPLTHDLTMSCIGWVQVGGAWALRMPLFHVCPKPACCSCVCRGWPAQSAIHP